MSLAPVAPFKGSRSTIHGPRFTVHDSRSTIHGSRFTVHDAMNYICLSPSSPLHLLTHSLLTNHGSRASRSRPWRFPPRRNQCRRLTSHFSLFTFHSSLLRPLTDHCPLF